MAGVPLETVAGLYFAMCPLEFDLFLGGKAFYKLRADICWEFRTRYKNLKNPRKAASFCEKSGALTRKSPPLRIAAR